MQVTRGFIKKISIFILLVVFISFARWLFVPYRSILAQKSGGKDSEVNKVYCAQYVKFQTSDGETLTGWFFNRGKGSQLVICYPGNSCNAGMFVNYAEQDTKRSYLMLNYRGYGESTGRLKESNMVSDACEALQYFSSSLQADNITLFGFSLGTGVAVQVASRMPNVDKLVLAAPFDSMAAICGISNIEKIILKDHFDSVRHAHLVNCPVYVQYSLGDTVVRPENTRKLIDSFRCNVTERIVKGTHENVVSLPLNQKYIIDAL